MSFINIFAVLAEFINRLDYFNFFSYSPTFFIKRNPSYKSVIGSYVLLGYLLFCFYWMITYLITFIKEYEEIKVVKDILTTSKVRNFNNNDIQIGIGFKNQYGKSIMLKDLPGLEIKVLSYSNNNNESVTNFNLTGCDTNLMMSESELNQTSNSLKDYLTNLLNSSYLCPDSKFNVSLYPKNWLNDSGYFEILIKITNLSMLNSTMSLIKNTRPTFELIWGSYALKFNNYSSPFQTFIDSSIGYFLNNIVSTSEITLSPMILFDNYPFDSTVNIPFKSDINMNQDDGAIFSVGGEKIKNEDVFDRSIKMENDENLIFKRYIFRLSSQRREVSRYRTNFFDFLASMTALTAFVLFFLTVLMQQINDALSKKYIFKVLFSLKSFDNVLSFRNEFFQNYEKRNNSRRNNIINIDAVKKEEVKPQIELPINKTTHVFSVKNDIKKFQDNFQLDLPIYETDPNIGDQNFLRNKKQNNVNIVPDLIEKNSHNIKDNSKLTNFSTNNLVNIKGDYERLKKKESNVNPEYLEKSEDVLSERIKLDKLPMKIENKGDLVSTKSNKFDFLLLDEAYFEYGICDCCWKKKKQKEIGDILYKNADNYLIEFLGIETLFAKYQELDMIKKLMFDNQQTNLFEILSKLTNLAIIFSASNKQHENDLFDINNKVSVELFLNLDKIKKRGNQMDLKLLESYESLILE